MTNNRRRLLLLWLLLSTIWIVFALRHFKDHRDLEIDDELGGRSWTFAQAIDLAALLVGVPLAVLGSAIALGWIFGGPRR
ncbi:hypothetical protein SAMN02745126_02741 [Enhydrobacter aerosaccus]|uniref:Uncharacterized protein n=1 Tax=Enhydrobacter aerosaccus TaxID=225324 RepID=A0A1T4PD20_9HYPH|nr:hypothetical protein [Enhydrobacter aerosaccus]SJZ89217.1 hypothetical protein SAMN02745126_02741 [Enhydrobacter aerosaccus]